MRVIVAAVGRPKEGPLADGIREYEGRVARYWSYEGREVREESGRATPPALVMEREGERLLAQLPVSAQVVACDPGGSAMDSERFAHFLRDARDAARDVAFVIGGAHGLAPSVRSRAGSRLALAPWTLPHELARLVLTEQIYRAGTILRGEPYHK